MKPSLSSDSSVSRAGLCRRRGYVLVLVLFVIALAAAALAGVSRMSMARSMEASRAEADLQRRWAVVSCRSVLLPKAEAVLVKAGAQGSSVRRDLVLNGERITLIFGDEQAKANVNYLYAEQDLAGADRAVRGLVQSTGGILSVELRPIPGRRGAKDSIADQDPDQPPAFESFGQVFRNAPPSLLTSARGAGATQAVADLLTCWGDGSLNLRRAPAEAVRTVCAAHLPAGQISRLLDVRAKNPDLDASAILDQFELSERTRETLDDLLIDDSSCHSLWIITHTRNRNWYDLAISGGTGDNVQLTW